MFRRSGKNSQDDSQALYGNEAPSASPFSKYGAKKSEPQEAAARLFESPLARPTPMESQEDSWSSQKTAPLPHHYEGMIAAEETPETTLGAGVSFRGQLSFERYLRIDGTFEGELLSQGKIVVGPTGKVKSNLNLREAIIEGVVEGNITVQEKLELRGEAIVKGDIQAKSLCVDEGVTITGYVLVTPKPQQPPPSEAVV
jgi:cytoskeletal protein CcmA (bactofilin family)